MAELNQAQREAVTAPPYAVLQILAGPGSGKTKVLTHRVCFLLEQGMKAENIILTTFTNVIKPTVCIRLNCKKAAREMKERIGKLGGHGVESRLITGPPLKRNNRLMAGTFHSICRRYLVKYGSLINLPKGFGIADADDT
jgi:DNA helicase II / ATP-dependent DNA helicase PcrA